VVFLSRVNEKNISKIQLHAILLYSIFFLLSCTPSEYSKALESYEKAKLSHSLPSLIASLKILVKFEPDDYQSELTKNLKLVESLNKAKMYMTDNNYYQAYLNSHDVYRQSLDSKTKELLIASGKKLTAIIKAQNNIEVYFNNHSDNLSKNLTKFAKSPVISWNVIEVNQLVSQLSKNRRTLKSALSSLNSDDYVLEIPEIKQWYKGIEVQLANINLAQNFILNRARNQSAITLLDIHKSLTKKSLKLLSYVNGKRALKTSAPVFTKAVREYAPYQVLIENISLALSLSRADIHASWYKNWQELENKILVPKTPFSNYPKDAKNIDIVLKKYIDGYNSPFTESLFEVNTLAEFSEQYPIVNTLINKLKRDKALI
jgi:hypothetical protein